MYSCKRPRALLLRHISSALGRCTLVLGAISCASLSYAEAPSGRALYEQGVRLASQKQFLQAQSAFQRAVANNPPIDAYFGLGQVELALGRPCAAVEAYSTYLEVGGSNIGAERRQAVADHIAQLKKGGAAEDICHPPAQPSVLFLTCEDSHFSADVDGKPVQLPTTTPLAVDVGAHRVTFLDQRGQRRTVDVEVGSGSATHVHCGPAVTAPPPAHSAGDAGRGRPSATHVAGWAVTGTGLGLAAATLAHFFWNHGRYTVWKQNHAELAESDASDDALIQHNDLAQSIERARHVTLGLAIASGVVTTTGVVLLLIRPSEKAKVAAQVAPERVFVNWSMQW